jgi:hypothetical protein
LWWPPTRLSRRCSGSCAGAWRMRRFDRKSRPRALLHRHPQHDQHRLPPARRRQQPHRQPDPGRARRQRHLGQARDRHVRAAVRPAGSGLGRPVPTRRGRHLGVAPQAHGRLRCAARRRVPPVRRRSAVPARRIAHRPRRASPAWWQALLGDTDFAHFRALIPYFTPTVEEIAAAPHPAEPWRPLAELLRRGELRGMAVLV